MGREGERMWKKENKGEERIILNKLEFPSILHTVRAASTSVLTGQGLVSG